MKPKKYQQKYLTFLRNVACTILTISGGFRMSLSQFPKWEPTSNYGLCNQARAPHCRGREDISRMTMHFPFFDPSYSLSLSQNKKRYSVSSLLGPLQDQKGCVSISKRIPWRKPVPQFLLIRLHSSICGPTPSRISSAIHRGIPSLELPSLSLSPSLSSKYKVCRRTHVSIILCENCQTFPPLLLIKNVQGYVTMIGIVPTYNRQLSRGRRRSLIHHGPVIPLWGRYDVRGRYEVKSSFWVQTRNEIHLQYCGGQVYLGALLVGGEAGAFLTRDSRGCWDGRVLSGLVSFIGDYVVQQTIFALLSRTLEEYQSFYDRKK